LTAEFKEQAQSHHLYPHITFDDMYQQRIHHTYLPQWYLNRQASAAQSSKS
jgi:hypothetical protein